jgi:hypothetical protein
MAAPVAAVAPDALQPSDSFWPSYTNFATYPANLVQKTTYPAALKAYASRLDQFVPRLFLNGQSYVPFREFTGIGKLPSQSHFGLFANLPRT